MKYTRWIFFGASFVYGKIHFNLTIPKFVSIIKIKNFGMKQEILQ